MSLAPCTSCRRHVRADEPRCPFCGGTIGEASSRVVARAPRVAILFAGALGIAGCSDDGNVVPVYGAPITDSATADTNVAKDSAIADTNVAKDSATADTTVTDTAKPVDATPETRTDTSTDVEDTWSPVPPYGAPMIIDSGDE